MLDHDYEHEDYYDYAWRRHECSKCVLIIGVIIALIFVLIVWLAMAHAKDTGEFADQPGAREWFKRPIPARCCSEADGHVATVKRTIDGGYEALIAGMWLPVPPAAVRNDETSPFPTGVIWYVPFWHENKITGYTIRCLILNDGA